MVSPGRGAETATAATETAVGVGGLEWNVSEYQLSISLHRELFAAKLPQ